MIQATSSVQEKRLYDCADKCLSVVESSSSSNVAVSTQPPPPQPSQPPQPPPPPLQPPPSVSCGVGTLRRVSSTWLASRQLVGGSLKTAGDCRLNVQSSESAPSSPHRRELPPTVDSQVYAAPTITAAITTTSSTNDYELPPDESSSSFGRVVAQPPPPPPPPPPPLCCTLPRKSVGARDTLLLTASPLRHAATLRASLMPAHGGNERRGYITQLSDNRLRSLKRRYG